MGGSRLFERVAIIGVGLIGGSLGLSINRKSLAGEVLGIGRSRVALDIARECGAVNGISQSYGALPGCDLVVVATPVGSTLDIFKEISPHLSPGTLVTDVGSTKFEIVGGSGQILPPYTAFIGGHPMAGSEKEGITGADPYLFENALYVLTPMADTASHHLDSMVRLVEGIGARPVIMDPLEHDLSVAAVSHLPHLVAAALVNFLFDLPGSEKISLLAAGGFRDTTRIASGSPELWRDIFVANRRFVLEALAPFRNRLDEFQAAVEEGDPEKIYRLLGRARSLRDGMPARTRGYLPAFWEIVVTVPDRPGIFGHITGVLGDAGININDIEILRVREGGEGAIRLAFSSSQEQERAVTLLNEAGIRARKRN